MIFANWLATTSAMSGKSPIHSSRRLVPESHLSNVTSGLLLDHELSGSWHQKYRNFRLAGHLEPNPFLSSISIDVLSIDSL